MLTNLLHFYGLLDLLVVLLSIFMGIFLFWRAGRHELLDSELLLDTVIVSSVGGLIFGRLLDFIVRWDKYHFSLGRLVFFNAYSGIDFTGVLFGFCLAAFIFLRARKIKFLEIFDLAAPAIVFAQSAVYFGRFGLSFMKKGAVDFSLLYFGLGYFVIFWILKRLGMRRRHPGFFACFYLFLTSILGVALFSLRNDKTMIGNVPYKLALGILLLLFSLVLWHITSGRSLKKDIKWTTAGILLSLFRFKRVLASVDEGGNLARVMILSPYYLAKKILMIVKFIGREIVSGLYNFLVVLGVKKYR